MNQNDNKNKNGQNRNGNNMRGLITLICWALLLTLALSSVNTYLSRTAGTSSVEIPYSDFLDIVEDGNAKSVQFDSQRGLLLITPVKGFSYTAEDGTVYDKDDLELYTVAVADTDLVSMLHEHGVEFTAGPYKPQLPTFLSVLISTVVPFLIIMAVFSLVMRWMSKKGGGFGGIGGIGGVGKANAKVYMEKSTGVTFRDVAGQDEAKESLTEIIDFLHNPQKYTDIGAKLPKGALLVGPPGTGKTLLAKAVAGEANVPFFSISGSDFVEMFVGVGASRVRDLFKEASKVAPCIVFIDEIDTIGKSRDGGKFGGNDEREQTLNQLLAEMDGFDPTKGVILLAATNRPEVLDQALLRPGRFDRRITVDRPNLAGRVATLQVHTRNIRLAEDVDLRKVALATAGCVGADLANLVNEAALRAVRKGRKLVTQEDLLSAFELVIAGTEKKGSVLTEFEKRLVAYHEVGHAMVAYKQKNTEPVQKITIVPHTQGSLGYTLLMPEEDKTELRTRDELMGKITVSMGGRAAEEVVLHTMTNGASQDIQDATQVARNMVAMYGMSDQFGMMALASRRSQYLDGGYGMDCAQDTAAAMDTAVKKILDECYHQAVKILEENRDNMDKVVAYLLEKETITGGEMVAILEGRDPSTAEDAYASSSAHTEGGFRPSSPDVIEPAAKKVHIISRKIEGPPESGEANASPSGETPQAPESGADAPQDGQAPQDSESGADASQDGEAPQDSESGADAPQDGQAPQSPESGADAPQDGQAPQDSESDKNAPRDGAQG